MSASQNLDKLTISGFQSIRHLESFPLHQLNVLIGANGAGKSNFINYFRMLGEMVEQRLQVWVEKRGGADRLLTFGIKETPQLYSRLWFGQNGYRFTLEPTDDGKLIFAEEKIFFHDSIYPKPYVEDLGSGHREALLKENTSKHHSKIANYCYRAISNWKIFHFHDTSDTADIKRWGEVDDAAYLRADASNLAAFLYKMRDQNRSAYNQIRKTIQLAIPFFDDFILEPRTIQADDQQIRLLWRQRESDYPMWPTQLSDGSLRFMALATALLQPNPPSTIIIDEPELGLHPYAITLLGSLMRSAATRMQVIVSTQSVPLLNEFELEDIIVVELDEGVSVFKRLESTEFEHWLEDYTIGELWEKNILGGRPSR